MEGLRVVLVAEESAGVQALRRIRDAGHVVARVLSSSHQGDGPVARAAAEFGVPVSPAELVRDPGFTVQLADERIDLLLNVHSLHLIHPEVLGAPAIGSFNLHPGPLPEYAGLNVPSWAIYRGETSHGVTLHWISAEIDAGPIAYSDRFEITRDDTGLSLTGKCARHGVPLISRLLEDAALEPGRIPADQQDMSRRRYFEAGPPHGGRMPWDSRARELVDLVRASDYLPFASPWGYPSSSLGGREIGIVKASLTGERCEVAPGTVDAPRADGVRIAAADEWVEVARVTVDAEPVDARDALAPGDRLAP